MKELLKNKSTLIIAAFVIVMLTLILLPILIWKELVVPVCLVMILSVVLAALLHKSELWLHGVTLGIMILTGILMGRFWLMLFCVLAYIAATVTLQFAFEKDRA